MTGTTISSIITNTVTLGGATYSSPLTITMAGEIAPNGVAPGSINGADGVIGVGLGVALVNDGIVFGGLGAPGLNSTSFGSATNGGNGGIAVDLASGGDLLNAGHIEGGLGDRGGNDNFSHNAGAGGAGGIGVSFGAAGTITNTGTILGGPGGPGGTTSAFADLGMGGAGGDGIHLATSDQLINSGTIMGGTGGVGGTSQTGTVPAGSAGGFGVVSNSGSVVNSSLIEGGVGGQGASGFNGGSGGLGGGAALITAGIFTNDSTGLLLGGKGGHGGGAQSGGGSGGTGGSGGDGVVITGGTFINQGTVNAGGFAYGGSGHTGNGQPGNPGNGIYINGGTVIDTGVIGGGIGLSVGDSVLFGTAAGTLEIGQAARLNGLVAANPSVADVLEFGSGAYVAHIGEAGFFGITGFNHFSFANGASAAVSGTVTAFDAHQTITGFAFGDQLGLQGFAADPSAVTYVAGTGLELSDSGTVITLDITGVHLSSDFVVSSSTGTVQADSVTSITLNPPCFAAGTSILTANGEVAVERLNPGDAISLADGGTAPLIWLGHRHIDIARHPHPEQVRPVQIEAGAIADRVPARDLLVSPDHALYLNGHLIPAKVLINGATIRQIACAEITYYHVELPAHAILYADGAQAESYLETGNRGAFENGGVPLMLHPDLAQAQREADGCAPFATKGRIVEQVRRRLLARARITTTSEPALTIRPRADGAAIITSRSAVPGHITQDPRDCRQLGVKIASLSIDGITIPLDHPALTEGWHDPEPDGRWTNGAGVIPPTLSAGSKDIIVSLAATMLYPVAPARRRAPKRAR